MGLIFGSVALKYWLGEDFRQPKDLDIMTKEKPQRTANIEYHYNPAFDYIIEHNKHSLYVDLNFLYTIKLSHLAYDINWDKHAIDVIKMQRLGCKKDETLYKLLQKDWEVIHGKKRVNLNMTKEEFFTPYVTRRIDHDELHQMLAHNDYPMYTKILKEGADVMCDIKKWRALTHEEKLLTILEEIWVTAYERWPELPAKISKTKATKLYCTSLAKNEYFEYAIDNLDKVIYNEHDRVFTTKIKEIQNAYRRTSN